MMIWIQRWLMRRLEKKKLEVIRLRWEKAELERKTRERQQ